MGLGLHIVREGVRQMGGTVTLTSVPDHGTTVVILLPWREGGEEDE
jgi:signal transduction histidine kinase